MSLMVDAISFGVAVAFITAGLAGVILPILPGTLLIWLSVLAYALVDGFKAIDAGNFAILTLIALVTGTSDIWMSILGAKSSGASWGSMILGAVGAIIGFLALGALLPIVGNLAGGAIGYALGVLLGQYLKLRDWRLAAKASLGGLAGWGLATAIQLGGGLLILLIFIWQVLEY